MPISAVGSPFGNPVSGISPELMAWIRAQGMDQNISAQARAAIANRLGQQSASFTPEGATTVAPPPTETSMQPATPALGVNPQTGAPPTTEATQPVASPMGPYSGPQAPPFAAMQPTPGAPPAASPPPMGLAAGAQLPPEIAPGPARTPEEHAHRVSGWQQMIDQLKSDPKLQLMLLKFGTQLMQPIQPGQTAAGHVGQALSGSVDYLQAQQMAEAELAKTRAQTGQIGAQTTTEQQRPAEVKAQTGAITAQAGKTAEETKQIQAMTPQMIEESKAKVKKLAAEAGLDTAHADDYASGVTLKRDPRYIDAMVKELEARAYYYKNPQLHYNTGAHFQEKLYNDLKDSYKILDPGIADLIKQGTPEALAKADAMATDRANQARFAGTAATAQAGETATGNLDFLQAQYDHAVATGAKDVKGKPFEVWAGEQIGSPINMTDKSIKAQMLRQLGQRKKGAPASPDAGKTPSGAGGKPSTEDPLGIRK